MGYRPAIKALFQSSISVIIGIGIFTYLLYGESGKITFDPEYSFTYYIIGLASLISGWVVILFEKLMSKWLSWHQYITARFLLSLTLNTSIVLAITYTAYQYVIFKELIPIEDISIYVFTSNIIIKVVILVFVSIFILLIINLTLYSYNHYATGQIASVKLTRRQYELQFEALKSQLSPHYLFNCLNTISSLVYINPEQAETYIRRLVETYQYILTTKDKKLVRLAEELKFVNAYKFLLKVRYHDALKLQIDIPKNIEQTLLPPLTLQMLVENAVKHNDVSDEEPLRIKICLNHNHQITVSNTKNEKKMQDTSFKIGIENIKKRYQFFTESPVRVLNAEHFSVSLPVLEGGLMMR